MEMGKEIAHLYAGEKITKILTIEASGIAIAVALAAQLHVPVVFAKKSRVSTQNSEIYTAEIKSFTHGNSYTATVSKEFISSHKEIDWEEIEGLRHVLVHDYYMVNMRTLWNILQKDLPNLKRYVEAL